MAQYRDTRSPDQQRALVGALSSFTGIPARLIMLDDTELTWAAGGGQIRITVTVPTTLAEMNKIIQAGMRS